MIKKGVLVVSDEFDLVSMIEVKATVREATDRRPEEAWRTSNCSLEGSVREPLQ